MPRILMILLIPTILLANPMVGRVVKIQGKAELLVNPSKNFNKQSSQVLLNEKYYGLGKMKLGAKIQNGQVIRTDNESKVKIIFKNGDQHIIGPSTAYEITWEKKKNGKENAGMVSLMYGTLRGVIDKEGPRSGSKVKTKSAVMGVRGTDFFIDSKSSQQDTEITVLRGKVDVKIAKSKKKFQVETGKTLEVKKKGAFVGTTGKDTLKTIEKKTKVKQTAKADKETQKEINLLEEKAVNTTLKDIKRYDPKLYESLKDKKLSSTDELNSQQVAKLEEKAPVKTMKKAISIDSDAEELYKKYQ